MPATDINPIIPGFAPDPSIIQIDDTFFLVNSTFHVFPGLPIYASKDLISWKHIGNAIHRQSQLSLAKSSTNIWPQDDTEKSLLATGGLYAPTIRHHNDIIYIVCTNIIHTPTSAKDISENFIVSTTDIWSNEWSNPVYFEFQGIDPSIFFDDDGRSYIQGSAAPGPMTKIHLFEVDLKSGKKLSEEKKIWDGTGGIYPEGPHIYKKDGWYYLMISEGGTHEGHMITVARSKDIWGPYEAFEKNPILTAKGTNEYIRYTGHCDVIEDQRGQWWGVCLGVRKKEGRYNMGRETFLTTGSWPKGEWPTLNQVKLNPILDGRELIRAEGTPRLTAEPTVDYLYIRDAVLSHHTLSNDSKTITLTPSKEDLSQWKEPVTFIGKRQRGLEGTASVSMHHVSAPPDAQLEAGLAYYKDEHRYVKLIYSFSTRSFMLQVVNNAKKISRATTHDIGIQEVVDLRVEYTESSLLFSYRVVGLSPWRTLGVVDTLDLMGPDFVGPIIGVFATSQAENLQVPFDNLVVE
ncbi:probable xylosidase/arabinosidase [Phialocephala subalpina]|uniref:Probable xylosidase/arabinosidase n=1 Tax=Phialocephala subalpina TaxID=576137 RepID=A0A1L7XBD8_9HELO|nr:probable xylosidase/arabinosidase [Phialocephala subalpina]